MHQAASHALFMRGTAVRKSFDIFDRNGLEHKLQHSQGVCTLAVFRLWKLRPALFKPSFKMGSAFLHTTLYKGWKPWQAIISPEKMNVFEKCGSVSFYFFWKWRMAFCVKYTETTRIKEPIQKPKYYPDNISSCVNWIQIPKQPF